MRISPKYLERFGIRSYVPKPRLHNVPSRRFYEAPDVKYNWINGDCVGYTLHPRLYAGRPPKPFQQSYNSNRVSTHQNRSRRANKQRMRKATPPAERSQFNVDEWADRLLSAFENAPTTKEEIFSEEEIEFHRKLRREMEWHDGILGRMKFAQQYPEFRIGDANPFGGPDFKIACCVFGGARKLVFPVPLRLMIDTMAEHGDHYKIPNVNWPRNPKVIIITCRPIKVKGRKGLRLRENRFNTVKACITGSNTNVFRDFSLVYACKFLLGGSAFRVSKHKLPADMYGDYMSLWDKLSLPVPP